MGIFDAIGNTPIITIHDKMDIMLKLEGFNIFGSVKDRAAAYIIQKGLREGFLNTNTEIIESSSGNFAVALAGICKVSGLKFTCVIDPMISKINLRILEIYGAHIIMVHKADQYSSYVKERIRVVKEYMENNDNVYWTNQYDNPLICEAYRNTLGKELADLRNLEYLFVAVSSCGTIAGISQAVKKENSNIYIIAVDVEGSIRTVHIQKLLCYQICATVSIN